jgi:hypothetical protein
MMVTEQKTNANGGAVDQEWVLDLHTIPESFPFSEGHLIQSINLEKAEQLISINCVELEESDQMVLSDWIGGCWKRERCL